METALFYVFGTIAAAAAVAVVAARKVFYSAVSLIVCLAALAALYLLLEAPFIAAVQMIVYAGAIMVLFPFVIMLLDPFSAPILVDKRRYLAALGTALGAMGLVVVVPLVGLYDPGQIPHPAGGPARGALGTTATIGYSIFTDYLLPFEATSALILVAIIGAVVLAKRRPQA